MIAVWQLLLLSIFAIMLSRAFSSGGGAAPRQLANANFYKSTSLKAVVGASADRDKFGNKVLRCYQEHGYACVPVSKKQKELEGLACVTSLTELSKTLVPPMLMKDVGVSIILPPGATAMILREGYDLGVRNFFLQPGTYDAETNEVIDTLKDAQVIKACVLVDLGFSAW